MADVRHLHLMEKGKLQEETDRLKSELKFLRLEHSELISNTNSGEQHQNMHDEYLSEIQALTQQLSYKSQETMMVLEALEKQK